MKGLRVKLVPYSLAFLIWLLWPIGIILSEPVESNAPALPNTDMDSSGIIYDQRQTGKYNIHVSIKDVAIIDVDQNGIEDVTYDDDDYYYDDGYLTVKPILLNPQTTQKQPNISTPTNPTILSSTQQSSSILTSSSKSPTAISSDQNFSTNLFADIAATSATNNDSSNILLNSTLSTTTPDAPKKGTQNVIILDTQSMTDNSPTSTHKPIMSSTIQSPRINARSEDVPIPYNLPGGLLHASHKLLKRPHIRFVDTSLDDTSSDNQQKEQENDSKIFKFKVRRAQKQASVGIKAQTTSLGYPIPHLQGMTAKRCRRHQYRDASGDCRAKRSSSILKKLFNMLVTLPFPNERAIDDRDDE